MKVPKRWNKIYYNFVIKYRKRQLQMNPHHWVWIFQQRKERITYADESLIIGYRKNEQESFSLVSTVMMNKVNITILPAGEIALTDLTYVVIGAREEGNWIFVRHRERQTWELPAGHIEKNEQPFEAAKRELYEETGTVKAEIHVLNDYSVIIRGRVSYGRIFFAAVEKRGPLPESEIAEILVAEETPLPATYPEAHKVFVRLLEKYIRQTHSKY